MSDRKLGWGVISTSNIGRVAVNPAIQASNNGELLAVAAPGAVFALGVNEQHFADAGFGDWFAAAVADGRVGDLEIVEQPIYDADRYAADDAAEHAGTAAAVVVFGRI